MGTKDLQLELAEAQKADILECQKEIQAILEKYGCMLDPLVTLTGTGMQANVRIIKNNGVNIPD